jgi:alanyl-tRNA synthetase
MCISEGILPSNTGRGYVLRRLIRRAVLKGNLVLELPKPFLKGLINSVIQALGDHYTELVERRSLIEETIEAEEVQFRVTLAEGVAKFQSLYESQGKVTGADAFFLHDTLGFPLEITQELAQEKGISIDIEEYQACLAEAQERSRAAHGGGALFGEAIVLATAADAPAQTVFAGYKTAETASRLVQISPRFTEEGLTNGSFQVCLDVSPFYAESGGQVGDTGTIECTDFEFRVTNTWREIGQIWHDVIAVRPTDFSGLSRDKITEIMQTGFFFKNVAAKVDSARRRDITRNHTATHLLHAALRHTLGEHVTQAGSLVAPDRLRFDFTHGKAMTKAQLAAVEEMVNRKVAEAIPVQIHDGVPISEARSRGAMMLFGEKYGDQVRMVEAPGFSLELCGGLHVRNTAEIGTFKIISESSSSSGVRRIEALTGYGAYQWAVRQESVIQEAASKLRTDASQLLKSIDHLKAQVEGAKEVRAKQIESMADSTKVEAQAIGQVALYPIVLSNTDVAAGKVVADNLVQMDPDGVSLVAVSTNGRGTFLCKARPGAISRGVHAGNLVREIAKLADGGGGGSPEFAQAGAKDVSKIAAAMAAAPDIIKAQTGGD